MTTITDALILHVFQLTTLIISLEYWMALCLFCMVCYWRTRSLVLVPVIVIWCLLVAVWTMPAWEAMISQIW